MGIVQNGKEIPNAYKNGKLILGMAKKGEIIYECADRYIRVAGLKSTGTQYVDLGFIPNNNTRVVAEVSIEDITDDHMIFGAGYGSGNTAYEAYIWNSGVQNNFNNDYGYATPIYGNRKFTLDKDKNKMTLTWKNGSTSTNTTSYTEFTAPFSLYLWGLHRSAPYPGKGGTTIYSCKVYDNGELIMDLVPCYRSSDNKTGVYDKLHKVFYPNLGAQELVIATESKVLPFGECTDEELQGYLIQHYSGEINLTDYWKVGDTRVIHLNSIASPSEGSYTSDWPEQNIIIVIVAMNYHDLKNPINGNSKAIITCQTREALNNLTAAQNVQGDIAFSPYISYSFKDWSLLSWMNNDFYSKAIPTLLKDLIVPINHNMFDNRYDRLETTYAQRIFLPTLQEVEYSSTYSVNSIYKSPLTYFLTESNKIKYGNNNGQSNGVPVCWWVATHGLWNSVGGDALYIIQADGTSKQWGSRNEGNAFAPMFCLAPGTAWNIKSFSECSDTELKEYLDMHYSGEIDLSRHWKVGDTRTIHINEVKVDNLTSAFNEAQDIQIVILGFNKDTLTTAEGIKNTAALTLGFKEVFGSNNAGEGWYYWGSQLAGVTDSMVYNTNTWMDSYLNDKLYNSMSASFRSLIKPVNKKCLTSHTTGESSTESLKLWLLSYPEVFGTTTYANYLKGAAVSTYEGSQYPYFENSSNRIKYINNNGSPSGTSYDWWLRSPASSTASRPGGTYGYCQCVVSVSGTASSYGPMVSNTGYPPAFCL